ncbi:MAG TPA: PVC-type heme-binding CxxCH protein, partial [Gemmataceae bacterium]|nr:PVC-type heme-binding CxxCH protein [Gemmataceae bacterium]
MRAPARCIALLGVCGALSLGVLPLPANGPPQTGPATEKRFPPLKVPPNFKATLFACDPLIAYPSAVALGPRPGSLFVAADYMTGLGTEIVRHDEIRLIEDTDGDGYADRATVYAAGFNSVQGLTYHNGTLYVMHAPFLTALQDTRGKSIADKRVDLLSGLGLTPEENPVRLHCANGLVMGHDGWLYLALGDHGCKVTRPEGDRLVLEGGGVLRCRPDGRDLHVFASGLRNIYDVALDDELNVFVRDNENDGGTYMVRVCHSFYSADHGYPYLYDERPAEALPPLADLGLGSSAGGLCYMERQFPAGYRGNLFFCEWGRAVMRYHLKRAGGGFAPVKEIEFAAGAGNDPYGFKPTDLVVERDGSLIVADWADDQRPRRGRGRIYRIRYTGEGATAKPSRPLLAGAALERSIVQLDSTSYYDRCQAQAVIEARGREGIKALTEAMGRGRVGVRGRLHAVWLLARVGGPASLGNLFALARTDADARVQSQAVRAIADLTDPVLTRHRLDGGRGDTATAAKLARLAQGKDDRCLLEVIIALGRLRWPGTPDWLRRTLKKADPTLAHAAMQALRRLQDWPALLSLLDKPGTEPLRAIALRACADQAVPELVDGLIGRLGTEQDADRRREYAALLTRVYKKLGPTVYWGYRPPPRPPNTV